MRPLTTRILQRAPIGVILIAILVAIAAVFAFGRGLVYDGNWPAVVLLGGAVAIAATLLVVITDLIFFRRLDAADDGTRYRVGGEEHPASDIVFAERRQSSRGILEYRFGTLAGHDFRVPVSGGFGVDRTRARARAALLHALVRNSDIPDLDFVPIETQLQASGQFSVSFAEVGKVALLAELDRLRA